MNRFRPQCNNPITPNIMYGGTNSRQYEQQVRVGKRVCDGLPHVCPDGHHHGNEREVTICSDAHKVYVCCSEHLHTEKNDAERCDQIKRYVTPHRSVATWSHSGVTYAASHREENQMKDKELARKHEREMMDKQIKIAESLRAMGWNFQRNGMPALPWKDCS